MVKVNSHIRNAMFIPLCLLVMQAAAQNEANKLASFYDIMNKYYVNDIDRKDFTQTAIKSILSDLDPHSSYLSAEEASRLRVTRNGAYSGIGVIFEIINDTATISDVFKAGPADRAGIMKGDRIVSIDRRTMVGMGTDTVSTALKGTADSRVNVGIMRGGKLLDFDIKRNNLLASLNLSYKLNDTTGYISLNGFNGTTMSEFTDAFYKMDGIETLILDLRGNSGGYINEALKLANFFLEKGTLLGSNRGKSVPSSNYVAENDCSFRGKLIVLCDENTASASELFMGAVQDWDRAVIVGRRSFGKAMIMQDHYLPDGSLVVITQSYNYTPCGRSIQRPYDKGKKEEYFKDINNRLSADYTDSLRSELPKYKTLRLGREIIGGGGIYPDFHVSYPGWMNTFVVEMAKKRVIQNYIASYLEKNEPELRKKYQTFQTFDESFTVTPQMIGEIREAALKNGITCDTASIKQAESYIKTFSKTLIARELWSIKEAFLVGLPLDQDINRALEILADWDKLVKL